MIENYIGKEVRVGAGDNVTGCGVRGILKLTDGVYDCTGKNGSIQFKGKDVQYWNAFLSKNQGCQSLSVSSFTSGPKSGSSITLTYGVRSNKDYENR